MTTPNNTYCTWCGDPLLNLNGGTILREAAQWFHQDSAGHLLVRCVDERDELRRAVPLYFITELP